MPQAVEALLLEHVALAGVGELGGDLAAVGPPADEGQRPDLGRADQRVGERRAVAGEQRHRQALAGHQGVGDGQRHPAALGRASWRRRRCRPAAAPARRAPARSSGSSSSRCSRPGPRAPRAWPGRPRRRGRASPRSPRRTSARPRCTGRRRRTPPPTACRSPTPAAARGRRARPPSRRGTPRPGAGARRGRCRPTSGASRAARCTASVAVAASTLSIVPSDEPSTGLICSIGVPTACPLAVDEVRRARRR